MGSRRTRLLEQRECCPRFGRRSAGFRDSIGGCSLTTSSAAIPSGKWPSAADSPRHRAQPLLKAKRLLRAALGGLHAMS